MISIGKQFVLAFVTAFALFVAASPVAAQGEPNLNRIYKDIEIRKGKRPIILIPGLLGSELLHEDTGEKIWFRLSRSDLEDLKLPVALNLRLSKDKLVPGDILREIDFRVFPDVDIYRGMIDSLTRHGGYTESSWKDPPETLEDKLFVFPYDWRRDNVETAHILLEEIEELKRKTNRPDAKFNVLAHSMGGLIARYAVMYGQADLPADDQAVRPTWSGAHHFNKIFFFGTPNEGSAEALRSMLRGKSSIGGTINIPFVRYLDPVEIATMPAIFQLLPHNGTTRFFDEDLKPLEVNLYDLETWRKYKWAIYSSDKYLKKYTDAEKGRFEEYFGKVLKRARAFHRALDAEGKTISRFETLVIGSDCSPTLNAMVIYKDKKGRWKTRTKASSFKNSKGIKIKSSTLRNLMFEPGDGSVTRRSLLAASEVHNNVGEERKRSQTASLFVCAQHDRIMTSRTIQNNLLVNLLNEPVEPKKSVEQATPF